MAKFKIFTDSCSDLSTDTRKQYDIDYCHMGIVVDGEEKIADLDWNEYSPEEFYGWLKEGKHVKTTQVSVPEFLDCFRPALKEGYDILYISCSSRLSGSCSTCETLVIPQLLEEFPDRKVVAVDSLNATSCEGMMAIKASEMRKAGKTLDEVVDWLEENKLRFNFFATVDTLTYLKAAGRIKGAKAFFGNLMGVKPVFISDAVGNNSVVKKVKGTKNSIEAIIEGVKEVIEASECDEVFVGQGMAQDRAEVVKKRLEDELNVKVTMFWIGPIVGTTCGPGVFVGCCFGQKVTFVEGAE